MGISDTDVFAKKSRLRGAFFFSPAPKRPSANPQRPCQHLRRHGFSLVSGGQSQLTVVACPTSLSLNLLFPLFLALLLPFAAG